MHSYKSKTFADAYKKVLFDLRWDPDYSSSPRGMKINELYNTVIEITDPTNNAYKNERRSSQLDYIKAEFEWYFSGSNTIEMISKHAKMWKSLLNPDGKTVNSAYGNLIFKEKTPAGISEYEWAIESLKKDKDTRQAIMHFNKPKHLFWENKDQVCTMEGTFAIRDNKLMLTVVMRSNDAILGLPTDIAFFTTLQMQALSHLKKYYPELELGTYTHVVHSLHVYERHFDLVTEMLCKEFENDKIEFTNDYIDEKCNYLR